MTIKLTRVRGNRLSVRRRGRSLLTLGTALVFGLTAASCGSDTDTSTAPASTDAAVAPASTDAAAAPASTDAASAPASTDAPTIFALDREELPEIKFTTFRTTLFLNFWVMQEQGFDEARGFKAADISTEGGNTLYTPVIGGQADASYLLPTFAMLLAEGGDSVAAGQGPLVPLRGVFSAADPENVSTLVVAGPPDIQELEDLRGKTLATHNQASAFFNQLRLALDFVGVSVDEINVVEMPFGQMADAIRTGNVDAALMDNLSAYAFVAAERGHIVTPVAGAAPLDDYISLIPSINRGLLERDPELVKALLLGLLDGSAWIDANPDEALEFLMEKLEIPVDQRGRILEIAEEEGGFDKFPLDVVVADINATSMAAEFDLLVDLGLVQADMDWGAIFEGDEFVRDVQLQWDRER